MAVRRGDLASALSLIRRVGIPFGLAIEPEAGDKARALPRRPKAPERE
jgi:hypothetical protein